MEPNAFLVRHGGMPARRTSSRLAPTLIATLALGLAASGFLSGCGLLQGSAQVGPDLRPHGGADVSIPFGK